MTNSDRGREGVKNPENLADVICTCPLTCLCYRFAAQPALSVQAGLPLVKVGTAMGGFEQY